MCAGDMIVNGTFYRGDVTIGSSFVLKSIPVGTFIHNLEVNLFRGGQVLRAQGAYGRIMSKLLDSVLIKVRSGKFMNVSSEAIASIGVLHVYKFSNLIHKKAGFFRRKGWRPVVRGVAMNPVDHPHGGGEGKSSSGRPSVSRWG